MEVIKFKKPEFGLINGRNLFRAHGLLTSQAATRKCREELFPDVKVVAVFEVIGTYFVHITHSCEFLDL